MQYHNMPFSLSARGVNHVGLIRLINTTITALQVSMCAARCVTVGQATKTTAAAAACVHDGKA
jgi:hypothetical protein